VRAIERECLVDLAGRERPAIVALIAVDDVVGVAVARPPRGHVRRWRRAGAALAGAAGVDDCLNL